VGGGSSAVGNFDECERGGTFNDGLAHRPGEVENVFNSGVTKRADASEDAGALQSG
jgi:hypothetical protein